MGAHGKIRPAKTYSSLLNMCHPLAEASKCVSKHLACVVYTVFPEISIKNTTDVEITLLKKILLNLRQVLKEAQELV